MGLKVGRLGFGVTAILAVLAITMVWTHLVHTLLHPEPVTSTLAPHSLVWHGRVFSDRDELAAWLRSRGSGYKKWARTHPAAAAVFDPGAVQQTAARTPKKAAGAARSKKTSKEAAATPPTRSFEAVGGGDTGRSWWPLGLAVLASFLALLTMATPVLIRNAIMPGRLVPSASVIAQHQVQLIAAAATLAFGILVGVVLS